MAVDSNARRCTRQPLALLAALLLAGCGSVADFTIGDEGSGAGPNPGGEGGASADCATLFSTRVQPALTFCRTCHVPGGVGDVEDGRDFLLSSNAGNDLVNLRAAFDRLDRNAAGSSRILTMASGTDALSHTGGAPWPVGSQPYADMARQLAGFSDPAACTTGGSGPVAQAEPLLGSQRGGHLWDDYCEGKPDDTVLPTDPRARVLPGVNDGRAVLFNAYWKSCQADDQPANCGEQRARVARGYPIVASDGEVGAGSMFEGNASSATFSFPAERYNTLWRSAMNLPARPDNFDQLISQRWGMPLSLTDNPYPLPGEDPNASNGGSGQLPIGLTQLREADGRWTGRLNPTCSICHGGEIGTPADGAGLGPIYGTNSQSDITVMFTDLGRIALQQTALAAISQNKVRGTGNITNFQLFGTLTLFDDSRDNPVGLLQYLGIQTQPSTGTEDQPVWWNVGHRPWKFFDGGQVMSAKRIELSFHFPDAVQPNNAAGRQWILDHQQDGDAWIASLKSPAWPESRLGSINLPLAEQGAILFHAKDLWASGLANPVRRPEGGNGSCASCHGAHSPRYAHDPAFLADPDLEGIAGYITPIDIIDTDRRRLDGNSQLVASYARNNWFAYSDGPFDANGIPTCADQNDIALRGDRELGYLAPPLYGVWASAPYFHNGSVPSVWEVLEPDDRQPIWRRRSNAPRADQAGQVVMGFDARLEAYDAGHLGWRYDALACGSFAALPYLSCNPRDEAGNTLQDVLGLVYGNGGLAWNLLNVPILTDAQIEQRKIYNTHLYSQSNGGHAFTQVLTDVERRALVEYLKTL
jgi:hypothetical protein